MIMFFHIYTFVPYATPERRLIKESSAIYKKAWVAVPVARPTLQGVSHCPFRQERATQKPRRICVHPIGCIRVDERTQQGYKIHIPMGIYRCFVIRRNFKFARL